MNGAYNPFMQTPDYGNWAQQTLGQLAQVMLLRKMFAERGIPEKETRETVETPAIGGDQLMQAGGFLVLRVLPDKYLGRCRQDSTEWTPRCFNTCSP